MPSNEALIIGNQYLPADMPIGSMFLYHDEAYEIIEHISAGENPKTLLTNNIMFYDPRKHWILCRKNNALLPWQEDTWSVKAYLVSLPKPVSTSVPDKNRWEEIII